MAKKKVEQVTDSDDVGVQFANELSEFLDKTLDIQLASLRDYGQIPYWIDTRCLALNWIISNDFNAGIPGTYMVLISGEPGKGKSLLMDVLLGSNVQMGGVSMKAGIERAVNYNFTTQIVGSKEIAEKIRLIKPKEGEEVITIEKLTSIIYRLLDFQAAKEKAERSKSILLGIDSVTQLTSEKELKGVDDRAKGKEEKKDMTSAQEMRKLFRTIEQRLETANTTIIGIGQLTANISTGFTPVGTPKQVINVKGSGFNYASSLTIQVISDREIVDAKTGIPIGIRMKMKTTKNRVKYKGRDCWIHFYFNRGIDRFGGLPELLTRYGVINAFNIEMKKDSKGVEKEVRKKVALGKSGDFEDKKPTFSFIRPDGSEVLFTQKNIQEILTEDILREINAKLNEIYENILNSQGVTEAELVKADNAAEEEEEESTMLETENEE